jgi:uncharacterized protein YndB with AHSA1/START domain
VRRSSNKVRRLHLKLAPTPVGVFFRFRKAAKKAGQNPDGPGSPGHVCRNSWTWGRIVGNAPKYILNRSFEAPRELVWKAWTDGDLLARWYGLGAETVVHSLDVKPGGTSLVEMKSDEGPTYLRAAFTEVAPPEKLVWQHSFCDAAGGIIPAPRMPDWPRVLLTTVTFEPAGQQTKVQLVWQPEEAAPEEIAGFGKSIAAMDKGWTAGMELLGKVLAELKA